MKTKKIAIDICMMLLVLMFTYAACSKLMDYDNSKLSMMKQLIPAGTAPTLTWLVPVIELLIVILLLFNKTRLLGLYASAILMAMFSAYIAIALSGLFGHRACSCGGILSHMGYWGHLVFNLVFVGIALMGIKLEKSMAGKSQFFHKDLGKGVTGL